jgi:hypothetical protein
MKFRNGFVFLCCVGVLLLTGCAKYRPKPLNMPQNTVQEKNGLLVQASLMSTEESREVFGNRSPQSKGFLPIQLAITNKTPQAYQLDASHIGLELVPADHVARQISFNTAGRVAGWGIAGLFIWPFLIPAFVEGSKSSLANKELSRDFEKRTISTNSKVFIGGNGMINRVMFVDAEKYKTTFAFDLINQNTGDVEKFTVNLA